MDLQCVIGADSAKKALQEAVFLSRRFAPGTLRGIRAPPNTILLHGPPGTGKTLIVRELAAALQVRLVSISPASVLSKWAGDSEKALQKAFRRAAGEEEEEADGREVRTDSLHVEEVEGEDAADEGRGGIDCVHMPKRARVEGEEPRRTPMGRQTAGLGGQAQRQHAASTGVGYARHSHTQPASILFIDEIDSLAPRRGGGDTGGGTGGGGTGLGADVGSRRILTQLLLLLSQYGPDSKQASSEGSSLLVIAATNRPEDVDPAILRRFERRVYVGLPSPRDRAQALAQHMEGIAQDMSEGDWSEVVHATEGWNYADLRALASSAAMGPVHQALAGQARAQGQGQGGVQSPVVVDLLSDVSSSSEEDSDWGALLGEEDLRPVCLHDFLHALSAHPPSHAYGGAQGAAGEGLSGSDPGCQTPSFIARAAQSPSEQCPTVLGQLQPLLYQLGTALVALATAQGEADSCTVEQSGSSFSPVPYPQLLLAEEQKQGQDEELAVEEAAAQAEQAALAARSALQHMTAALALPSPSPSRPA